MSVVIMLAARCHWLPNELLDHSSFSFTTVGLNWNSVRTHHHPNTSCFNLSYMCVLCVSSFRLFTFHVSASVCFTFCLRTDIFGVFFAFSWMLAPSSIFRKQHKEFKLLLQKHPHQSVLLSYEAEMPKLLMSEEQQKENKTSHSKILVKLNYSASMVGAFYTVWLRRSVFSAVLFKRWTEGFFSLYSA